MKATPSNWTVESLSHLLTSNGYAIRRARRGPLFVEQDPTPTADRPDAVEHPTTCCLIWTGAKSVGYGSIRLNTEGHLLHRVTYVLVYGAVDQGLDMGHRCEVRPCARPDHVRPVPRVSNAREGGKRKWPDWLTARAPVEVCPMDPSHGVMSGLVAASSIQRAGWTLRCPVCNGQYNRNRTRGMPGGHCGTHYRRMDDDSARYVALHRRGEEASAA